MKLGAHISARAPFSEAVSRAKEIGCECMQIFVNPPQRWYPFPIPEEEIEKFVELNNPPDGGEKINPIIIHGIYLVNLASDNPFYYEASIKSLTDDMQKAEKIGALGTNFHVGSTKGKEFSEVLPKITDAIKKILDNSPQEPFLILENSAGAGNIIGDTIEELAAIIKKSDSSRLRVLIDTAHAFASGYDLRDKEGLEKFIDQFSKKIGLEKLIGFHFNDSKSALNSKRDRHADIGKGELGTKIFERILNRLELSNLFAILETPQDEINWPEQIKMLKKMRE